MWDIHSIPACGQQCCPCFCHDSHNQDKVKKKGKVFPRTGHKGPGGE